jgi:hypothetical protein
LKTVTESFLPQLSQDDDGTPHPTKHAAAPQRRSVTAPPTADHDETIINTEDTRYKETDSAPLRTLKSCLIFVIIVVKTVFQNSQQSALKVKTQ